MRKGNDTKIWVSKLSHHSFSNVKSAWVYKRSKNAIGAILDVFLFPHRFPLLQLMSEWFTGLPFFILLLLVPTILLLAPIFLWAFFESFRMNFLQRYASDFGNGCWCYCTFSPIFTIYFVTRLITGVLPRDVVRFGKIWTCDHSSELLRMNWKKPFRMDHRQGYPNRPLRRTANRLMADDWLDFQVASALGFF